MKLFKRKVNTGVLAVTCNGKVLIGYNSIPQDNSEPKKVSEATIKEITDWLSARKNAA